MQARGTDPKLPCQGSQARAQCVIEGQAHIFDQRVAARRFEHAERQRWLIDIGQHLAEETFMSICPDTQSDLCHVVAIRHGFGQGMAFAEQEGLHLVFHQLQRGVVDGNVVVQQDSDPAGIGRVFNAYHAHQRRIAQVQAMVPGIKMLEQLGLDGTVGGVQCQLIHCQRRLTQHHLHRFVEVFPDHRRAQDVMAIDHRLQCLGEVIKALATFGPEQRLQYIGVALRGSQVMIENPFLQRRQRVDVLHIASTARYRVDDPVDRFLA